MERKAFLGGSISLAAAAVTVAVGLTVASIGGHWRPARDQGSPVARTILVPVTPSATAPRAPIEPMVASNADHERRERHHHREHEHEDD